MKTCGDVIGRHAGEDEDHEEDRYMCLSRDVRSNGDGGVDPTVPHDETIIDEYHRQRRGRRMSSPPSSSSYLCNPKNDRRRSRRRIMSSSRIGTTTNDDDDREDQEPDGSSSSPFLSSSSSSGRRRHGFSAAPATTLLMTTLLLMTTATMIIPIHTVHAIPTGDRLHAPHNDTLSILETLYTSTNGANWINSQNWNFDNNAVPATLCSWYGITCDPDDIAAVRIIEINLSGNNLVGTFPGGDSNDDDTLNFFETLEDLQTLDLKDNSQLEIDLTGIGAARNLTLLYLSDTIVPSFKGFVDHGGGGWVTHPLQELHLTNCRIQGPIPSRFFAQYPSLTKLFLSFNDITGSLPDDVYKWTNLQELYAYQNKLEGPLPDSLGELVKLQHLVLGGNAWTGSIPNTFVLLTELRTLSIRNEREDDNGGAAFEPGLTGELPTFATLTTLTTLHLNYNSFGGVISPTFLGDTVRMTPEGTPVKLSVNLTHNELVGGIPHELSRFPRLDIDITGNKMTEGIPSNLCDMDQWMDGLVGQLDDAGCDGIACPPGYYAPYGRQLTKNEPCKVCASEGGGGGTTTTLLGAVDCGGDGTAVDITVPVAPTTTTSSTVFAPIAPRTTTTPPSLSSNGDNDDDDCNLPDPSGTRGTLSDLYEATGGSDWTTSTNWNTCTSYCTWHGITCAGGQGTTDGDVIEIKLSSNDMSGIVPGDIFSLSSLVTLDLSSNPRLDVDFDGVELASQLKVLKLSDTAITSLEELSDVPSLEELHLTNCGIKGTIPSKFFVNMASDLKKLYISHNKFSGTLPSNMYRLKSLEEFYGYQNSWIGPIPEELGQLTLLAHLVLGGNDWRGGLPTSFSLLSNLETLSFRNERDDIPRGKRAYETGLSGGLPSFETYTKLTTLHLNYNTFDGSIPTNLLSDAVRISPTGEQVKMDVNLTHNELDGEIPSELFMRFERMNLDVTGNRITEDIPSNMCGDGQLSKWMDETVQEYGCDALLCPRGTWAPYGRQLEKESPCQPCDKGENEFLGAVRCGKEIGSDNDEEDDDADDAAVVPRPVTFPPPPDDGDGGGGGSSVGVDGTLTERQILERLYKDTRGTMWDFSDNWLKDNVSICLWFGITCANEHPSSNKNNTTDANDIDNEEEGGGIVRIDMSGNDMEGTIPGELFTLSKLERLDLMDNFLHVPFDNIGDAVSLTQLYLSENYITSLKGIGQAKRLRVLYLSENNFTGSVLDEELFTLTHLRELDLSWSFLGGTIPDGISALSRLTMLNLNDNLFNGPIPDAIGSLSDMKELSLSKNSFTGTLPPSLQNLEYLEVLSIRKQKDKTPGSDGIVGPLLDFRQSTVLGELYLDGNSINGPIPITFLEGLAMTDELTYINLSHNRINGTVPSSLSRLTKLVLEVEGNEIMGIDEELCNMTNWMGGDVKDFGCNGILCPSGTYNKLRGRQIGDTSTCTPCLSSVYYGATHCEDVGVEFGGSERQILTRLYEETAGQNWMVQTSWTEQDVGVCLWFGIDCAKDRPDDDSYVTKVELPDNGLAGVIPTDIYTLPHLKALNFMRNGIDITFDGIDQASNLTEIYLSQTAVQTLEGLGKAPFLHLVYISDNGIPNKIPEDLYDLSHLRTLDLSRNVFTGTISSRIGELIHLRTLDLNDNYLSGQLPDEIRKLTVMTEMTLSENALSGSLPPGLNELSSIEVLSIRKQRPKHNVGITGNLPALENLSNLFELYIDDNSIHGPIPPNLLLKSTIPDGLIYLNFAGNALSGTIPGELKRFEQLIIRAEDNLITGIDPELCNMKDWMDGDVGQYGCDAILCPNGTYNQIHGRQTAEELGCAPCLGGMTTEFYGSMICVQGGPSSSSSSSLSKEREILGALYDATGGKDWWNNNGWKDPDVDVCGWYGITCDDGSSVDSIRLGANNLVGTPPANMFDLPNLRQLWLYSNPMDFSFDGIDRSTKLVSLLLDSSGLKSLDGLGKATSLVNLDLRFNNLEGEFPHEEVSTLVNIETLFLSDNEFSGGLDSSSIQGLRNLRELKAGSNRLDGPLPSFAGFPNLQSLDLSGNKFSGYIPWSFLGDISDTSRHMTIDLSGNNLSGPVASRVFDKFDDLTLYLRGNSLTEVETQLCHKDRWNDGDVGKYGCDGLLCPMGTFSEVGRQREDDSPCQPCDVAITMGVTKCDNVDGVRGAPSMASARELSHLVPFLTAILSICSVVFALEVM